MESVENPTTIMEKEGKRVIVCDYNVARCKSIGWEVSEDQSGLVPAGTPADEPEASLDDAEPTPEDAKKIDELITEAEAEQVIEPEKTDPEQPDKPGTPGTPKQPKQPKQPEQPEQPKQPEQPAKEDDVIMPAE